MILTVTLSKPLKNRYESRLVRNICYCCCFHYYFGIVYSIDALAYQITYNQYLILFPCPDEKPKNTHILSRSLIRSCSFYSLCFFPLHKIGFYVVVICSMRTPALVGERISTMTKINEI